MAGLTIQPDRSHLRLTLDTEDDWTLIESIVDHFGDAPVGVRELTDWLGARPELAELNVHVRQRALDQA